jgi:hypothetical protein
VALISRVDQGAAANTSATIAAAEGDVVLVWASRTNSNTAPSAPDGWQSNTTVNNTGGGTNGSIRFGWRRAPSGGLSSTGVWTNATNVQWLILRDTKSTNPIGNVSTNGGSTASTSHTYPAVNLTAGESNQWVASGGGRTVAHANMATAPSGMVNHASNPSPPIVGLHSTDAVRTTNWPSTDVTGFTSAKHVAITVEVLAAPEPNYGDATLLGGAQLAAVGGRPEVSPNEGWANLLGNAAVSVAGEAPAIIPGFIVVVDGEVVINTTGPADAYFVPTVPGGPVDIDPAATRGLTITVSNGLARIHPPTWFVTAPVILVPTEGANVSGPRTIVWEPSTFGWEP